MKYFLKEIATNPITGPDGTPVPFDVLPSNTGLIALDDEKDKATIELLSQAAKDRRGGVVEIDAERFDSVKKNREGLKPSVAFSGPNRLQALRSPDPFKKPVAVADRVAAESKLNQDSAAKVSNTPNLDGKPAPKKPKVGKRKVDVAAETSESPPVTA